MSRTKRNTRKAARSATAAANHRDHYSLWDAESSSLRQLFAELKADKLWLLGLLVAAAIPRFWNLTQAALWMDEIIILQEAFTGKFKTVSYAAHAAHLIPQGWFLHLFGQNELGV
ncbi:hypothetical protein IT571_00390, partial [Candidatus Sumerlaeota bacterium]|nr:hypothetical protein [Candidatus Sumerlaeota bacterium]